MKKYALAASLIPCIAFATEVPHDLQSKLMSIAAEEAQIANIGANKYMMLYGKANPIPVINRWNQTEQRPALTDSQISQINELENKKQRILQQVSN